MDFPGGSQDEDDLHDIPGDTSESNIMQKQIRKWKRDKNDNTGKHWKDPPAPRKKDANKPSWKSNGCYPLDNEPTDYQKQNFEYAALADGQSLQYNCFIPTGQVYEFLPCAPWVNAGPTLGYKEYRGMHKIMDIEGAPKAGKEDFVPYKLLLYRGRFNNDTERDDGHRFVYLAESKPEDSWKVGDCFIRLEEIHKRMKGTSDDYTEDCKAAISQKTDMYLLSSGRLDQWVAATNSREEAQREGRALLRFRCWAVEGFQCEAHEEKLFNRLFADISAENGMMDHFEVFKLWAELLRKSQGDKLASKDFFGRYWDAAIPTADMAIFKTGFFIVVSNKYLQDRGDYGHDRVEMKKEVCKAVQNVLEAPRLKFKPNLTPDNIVFEDEFDHAHANNSIGWNDDGWRHLEPHPGALYTILVDLPVREFFCKTVHDKPLWQRKYPPPKEERARQLQVLLTECGKTERTTTEVEHNYVVAARKGKRRPTQDKCVAKNGYSANAGLAKLFPTFYSNAAKAKKARVAEWLHRSAFSYGGITKGDLSSSQVPNNLVLGTPATNTVMMRYEAFVKRLAYYSNNEKHDTVVVETEVYYPALVGTLNGWMGDDNHRYTWLAPILYYGYRNSPTSRPHVSVDRYLYPFNRESCMLFEALLDKAMESMCWGWNCWSDNPVADALKESTAVPDNEEDEMDEEEMEEMVRRELAQRSV